MWLTIFILVVVAPLVAIFVLAPFILSGTISREEEREDLSRRRSS